MLSETPVIIPFSSPHKMEVLSPSELQTIQNGTLHLLSEVGVYFPSEMALRSALSSWRAASAGVSASR